MSHPPTVQSGPRIGSPEDILRRVAAIPDRTAFPTVDALVDALEAFRRRHPELLTVTRIGTSRLGEPLSMYTIGDGSLSALVVGGVHPNEPIGSWTVLHLVEQLIEDVALREGLGVTWSIVPCIDPDGMRLNEGWFADPSDRGGYARRFYRPAPDEQVEWTFPFSYKKAYFDAMMPETQALARAIDATRPDLYIALHNSESGGVYYYLSRPAPELYDMLHRVPASLGVPLDKGEPEAAHFTLLAPAVFAMGTLEGAYDFAEELGLDPFPPGSGGNASSSYAEQYGTLSIIAELPYWSDVAADDTAEIDESYADVLRRTGSPLVAAGTRLLELLNDAAPELTLDTPLIRAARAFAPMVKSVGESNLARAELPASARPATVAERHGLEQVVDMYRLRFGGMLARALTAEVDAGTASAPLRRTATAARAAFEGWLAEAAASDTSFTLPVSALVGVQYGAILSACAYLASNR